MPLGLLFYVCWIIKMYTCGKNRYTTYLGPNIKGTSNYGTGKVLIGNMLSRLCS